MKTLTHWDVLLQRHKDPCFLVDSESFEVLFINDKMATLLGDEINAVGMKFNQVIKNEKMVDGKVLGEIQPNLDFKKGEVYRKDIYDSRLDMKFEATVTLIEEDGKPILFMSCVPDNTLLGTKSDFEQAMTECIGVMQEKEEKRTSRFLEILGEFYEADKTYLYRIDRDSMNLPCINFWRKNRDITVAPDLSLKMDAEKLFDWLEARDEFGMLEASLVQPEADLYGTGEKLLQAYQLKNMAMCIVENGQKEPTALLIVSNRKKLNTDFRLLQAVAKFMERDIMQYELKDTVCVETNMDILTGFHTRIGYALRIDDLQTTLPKTMGVLLANVNGLKIINSEFGYTKGDYVIKKSSEIIKSHFQTDFYRIAGDEFVAFFPNIEKEEFEAQCVALQQHIKESDQNLFALGHAWQSGKYDVVEMVKEADTVMYINKQEYYHNSAVKFQDVTDSTLSDLLSFLENEEFMIYLQPQVKLEDGSLYGAEALIRRFDKTNQRMVFPDQFISLYEKKSIIRHVDIFVVEQVCMLLAKWHKEGKELPISVNLSRVTLLEYDIVSTIADICDIYSIPRHLLVIEVTERVGLIENDVASSLILDFISHGFKISLDDFGCAYSNIVTLAQIEVDEVKLDKSLVDNLTINSKNKVLVRNVLRMCNELDNTSTLAEGIENEEQGKMLYDLGCHLGQGYYYSRPIPVVEFEEKYIERRE